MIPALPPVPQFQVPEVQNVPYGIPRATIPVHPSVYIPPAEEMELVIPNPKAPKAAESEDETAKPLSPPIVPEQTPGLDLPETEAPETSPIEVSEITLPVLNIKVPVPRKDIVSTAAITSGVSVGAAMSAQAILKRLQSVFKPLIKAVIKKINKLRNKPTYTWSRKRLKDRYLRGQGTAAK